MRRINHIHLIGIGGSGMVGIAEVLVNLNYRVSGSDIKKSNITDRLSGLGVKIIYSHIPENVAECDVVVCSSAIAKDNVEILMAYKRRIPVVSRAEMLAELMRFKQSIAIAGTHGKTTTTSLIVSIFAEHNLDPTYVIGGQLNGFGSSAKLGSGEYFIAEADESDASFLYIMPVMMAITNIDKDHMETYNNDFEALKQIFLKFIHQLPFYGLAVICIDDAILKDMQASITRPCLTYGFSADADIQAIALKTHTLSSDFLIKIPNSAQPLEITLNLPGKHNVLNALASIAIALEVGVSVESIQNALKNFSGIGRRFQFLGEYNFNTKNQEDKFTLVDDYGHHPKEIEATIDTARSCWPKKRLVMIFQPHRYSRTQLLFNDFINVLSNVDILFILDIYSAGEQTINQASSKALCSAIRQQGKIDPIYVPSSKGLLELLDNQLKGDDLLLTQGAGDIDQIVYSISGYYKQYQQVTC